VCVEPSSRSSLPKCSIAWDCLHKSPRQCEHT
jgi:hypothetical protein